MNRSNLFHGSMAAYGVIIGVDTLLSVAAAGLTVARGATVVASLFVLAAGLYGLRDPDRTSDLSDSWLAYLVAVGAVLVFLSVVVTRL